VSSWLTSSPDYLIGLEEERRGDGQAQLLRGLQVDHQLEFYGPLDGQVGRLGTFELSTYSAARWYLAVRLAP
jgi:hypothetical protein